MSAAATVATQPFRVHAFGAGVQSMALLEAWLFDSILMVREPNEYNWQGFFPDGTPDLCIFADTQAEPGSVYRAVEQARSWCELAGVPFEVVSHGDLASPKPASTGTQGVFVPLFSVKLETDEHGVAGEHGQLRRQCTGRYKIDPMMERVYELAGDRKIEVWMGISLDEAHRMKTSTNDRVTYHYPLIFDQRNLEGKDQPAGLHGMTRNDCVNYLAQIEWEAAKSACVFCPYRSNFAWAEMKRDDPEAFEAACAYDERVRDWRPGYKLYVHRDRVPLREAYLEAADTRVANLGLFGDVDMSASGGCEEGYCGI